MTQCAHRSAASVFALALALSASAATGCGSHQASGGSDGGSLRCQPGKPFDLSGTLGVLGILNVRINPNGGIPDDQPATSQIILLLNVKQSGTSADVTGKLCDIQIPEVPVAGQNNPIMLDPGPGLVDSVPPVSTTVTLSGTQTCDTIKTSPITILLGAVLDPPATTPLPAADSMGAFPACTPTGTTCADATSKNCVCDQEGDMQPGATLLASNVPGLTNLDQVYVDLRTTFSLDGEVVTSDFIRGEVTASLEQGILGCRMNDGTPCSDAERNAVKALNPAIGQDPQVPSVFEGIRVDPSTTCHDLVTKKDQIFPR